MKQYHIRTIDDIVEGESFVVTETISAREILLYRGVTNDTNPLFYDMAYARTTSYGNTPVPPVLIMGIMSSTVSNYLPGAGALLTDFELNMSAPLFPEQTISMHFEITHRNERTNTVTVHVHGTDSENKRLFEATLYLAPAERQEREEEATDDN